MEIRSSIHYLTKEMIVSLVNGLILISLGYSLIFMWANRRTTMVSTANNNNNGGEKQSLVQKQGLVIKPTSLPLSSN